MKETVLGDKARLGIKRGVDLIANAVKVTLGPRGRNVVYGFHYGSPIATKDGVTVARQVESSDQLEQLGVLLVRDVAQKTADDSGDGTTTACVLAQAIYTEGLKAVSYGANPILVKRGIDNAVKEVIEFIETNKKSISSDNEVFDVAMLSANNDEVIGNLICEAIKKVGNTGVITIEDNYGEEKSVVEVVEGMDLNEGMLSPFFMTNPEDMSAEYKNAKIILVDGELVDITPYVPLIEQTIKVNKRPLLFIAHNIIGTALQTLVLSKAQNGIPLLACKASQFGDYRADLLTDVAVATGGVVIGGRVGIRSSDCTYEMLGECEKVRATRFSTTIIGGKGKEQEIKARITYLEDQIKKCKSDYDREKLEERLAKLTTGVAVIKVGAPSEVEMKEIKMRVEDSVHAAKAAIEGGVVPGGAVMYLRASDWCLGATISGEEGVGYGILKKALLAPIRQVAENSGLSGEEVMAKIRLSDSLQYGYNFLTNEYGDLFADGVIDPAKVVINALKNAASVAGMLLTTDAAIFEREEDVVPPARTPKPRSE